MKPYVKSHRYQPGDGPALFLLVAVLFAVFSTAVTFLGEFLWNNALIPAIPGLNEVNFWQMYGILLFARIAFAGGASFVTKKQS
jgi:hypothetical protein